MKLVLNKQANSVNKLPKATAHLLTESIFLRVNKDQFGAALATANRFSTLTLGAKVHLSLNSHSTWSNRSVKVSQVSSTSHREREACCLVGLCT